MPKPLDITGQRFGRLAAITRGDRTNARRTFWLCRCDCGKTKQIVLDDLTSGKTQSCGCLQQERAAQAHYKHGGKGTREYTTWKNIKQRCNNPNTPVYRDYGARGITVCDRWLHSFENFLADMGAIPAPEYSIERVNNDLGYSPDNCIWATRTTQARNNRHNRSITYDGQTHTLAEWSEITGIDRMVITHRLGKLGWSIDQALTLPVVTEAPSQHRKKRLSI